MSETITATHLAVPGALIERLLPEPQERTTQHVPVDAGPLTAFEAIRTANLVDVPVTRILTEVAMVPTEVAARLRRAPHPVAGGRTVHLDDMLAGDSPWSLLGVEPGVEIVLGILWRPPTGTEKHDSSEFTSYRDPGVAKIAWSISVAPYGAGSLLLTETRTLTTDATARRRLGAVWPVVGPFARTARRGVLRAIRAEAESRRQAGEADTPAEAATDRSYQASKSWKA